MSPSRVVRKTALRRVLRWIRYLPERLFHPRRRRRAEETVRALPHLHRILVLCHGNICRSPYAEAAIRAGLAARGLRRIDVTSAGFIGPERSPPPHALATAAARGRDLSPHRSRLLGRGDLVPGTLVLVMDLRQRDVIRSLSPAGVAVLLLGDLDPDPITRRNVPDPIEQPRAVFESVYERLDRCAVRLVSVLEAATPRPDPTAPRTPVP